MARQPNDIYLENHLDIFTVVCLSETKKIGEFDVEIYKLHQKVKFINREGPAFGIDYLFHGERFDQLVTSSDKYINLNSIKERFEWHFKKQLNI